MFIAITSASSSRLTLRMLWRLAAEQESSRGSWLPRARSVVAIDLSPQMIRLAEARSANCRNIEYLQGDVMHLSLPAEGYDCIVSMATLHHLPLGEALLKMKDALKPDGVLIIHDLVTADGFADMVRSALAYPLSGARRFWKTGRLRAPRE